MNTSPFYDRSLANWSELPHTARLCEYLLKTGWIEVKQDNRTIRVFGTTQFGPITEMQVRRPFAIVPANDSYTNAKSLIRDAIELIAYFRKEDIAQIIREVFHFEFDTIRQRIEFPGIQGISLKIMPELMNRFRKLISISAYVETLHGEKNFVTNMSSNSNKNIDEIVQKCFFGHTFAGSFGITIDVPILGGNNKNMFQDVVRQIPTPERSIVRRIATGLNNTASAIQNDDIDSIVSHYQSGFNFNLCETMAEILELIAQIGETNVEYSFNRSPVILCDEQWHPVMLAPVKAIGILTEAKNEMQRLRDSEIVTIKGGVINLHDDPEFDRSAKSRRTITIRCRGHKKNIDKVKVSLSEEDYTIAALAHAHKSLLSVKGVIEQEGTLHRLKAPRDVKELDKQPFLLDSTDE